MRDLRGCVGRVDGVVGVAVLLAASAGVQADDIVVGEKPAGWVERALFTSAVVDREPVDAVVMVESGPAVVSFFTELRQLSGRTVTHRWEYAGEVVAEVPFEVGGPRWRVHSQKQLWPEQAGRWSVIVVDESGWILHAEMLEYRP
ncbi:MAG: DUF2914 domain-containing protein [Gammaproteobacteria bacterium]